MTSELFAEINRAMMTILTTPIAKGNTRLRRSKRWRRTRRWAHKRLHDLRERYQVRQAAIATAATSFMETTHGRVQEQAAQEA